jgi:hypothetical protein
MPQARSFSKSILSWASVEPVGIEPEGNRSDWSGAAGIARETLDAFSGGVALVSWCRIGMWDEAWDRWVPNDRTCKLRPALELANTERGKQHPKSGCEWSAEAIV